VARKWVSSNWAWDCYRQAQSKTCSTQLVWACCPWAKSKEEAGNRYWLDNWHCLPWTFSWKKKKKFSLDAFECVYQWDRSKPGIQMRVLSSMYFLKFCLECADLPRVSQTLEIWVNINGNSDGTQITTRALVSVSRFSFAMWRRDNPHSLPIWEQLRTKAEENIWHSSWEPSLTSAQLPESFRMESG
jgi:hypothetical protein